MDPAKNTNTATADWTDPRADQAALPPALLLLGPTASGKTAAALAIADALPVEIVSVDSALIYRDMDIGTAKPTPAEQGRCPHHLIDILSPEESYSAARFRDDAIALMRDIAARGRIPLLAGGTMLYFKALRDGLSDLPPADPALRAEIDRLAAEKGWPAVHAELARHDPETASRLKPTDAQRLQRALEICLAVGRPAAESYMLRKHTQLPCRLLPIALCPSDRSMLHQRIAKRFEQMLADGLIDEVRQLRHRYRLTADLPSMRCVGYRQVWSFLENEIDLAELRFKGIAATRQLAKRQLTWQRQFRETWPDLNELDSLAPDFPANAVDTARRLLA